MKTVFCNHCGIAEKMAPNYIRCVKFGFSVDIESPDISRECSYFTPPLKDGDEFLDPYETLAIKETEMASRRMRGPV